MPFLVLVPPDGSPRAVPLEDEPLVVGSDETCDVVVADSEVGGRHLRLRPREDGTWIARDLGSGQPTHRGDRAVSRAGLGLGDVLRIGGTRLSIEARAPASGEARLVGGRLALREVDKEAASSGDADALSSGPATPPPRPAPPPKATEAPAAPSQRAGPRAGRRRRLDGRTLGRALALVAIGLVVLVGAEVLLGAAARQAEQDAAARRDLRAILERMDVDFTAFQEDVQDHLARHPDTPVAEDLRAYLRAARTVAQERVRLERRVNELQQGLTELAESEIRGRLLALARAFPDDSELQLRVESALGELDDRHARAEAQALETIGESVEGLLAARDPAASLRRLRAFRVAWPAMDVDALEEVQRLEDRALAAADRIADTALAAAAAETDPERRRALLAEAWPGLAGLSHGTRVADALRYTGSGPLPAGRPEAGPEPATPATPTTPPPPEPATDVLARAAEAERLLSDRRWAEGRQALASLLALEGYGRLHEEWVARAAEVDRLLALTRDLGRKATEEGPLRRRVASGWVEVAAADERGVTLVDDGATRRLGWHEMAEGDLLGLLAPASPTPPQRLGLALLAAQLSERERFVETLIPFFAEDPIEAPQARREAALLVARYLDGRAEPPAGGYRVHRGEILDEQRYRQRLQAERIASLRDDARAALDDVRSDTAFGKLGRLRELRDELDRRRRAAILAIFNEKHYPYPYDRGSPHYRQVQDEIDRRVEQVREIWDSRLQVRIRRKGPLARALDAWDAALAGLRELGEDVGELEAEIAPYVAYVTGEPITIREYFRDPSEQRLLAYNRWVMQVHNPATTGVATEAERRQTQVTNEYRMMMGYAAGVRPGAAAYEAIDETNVAGVLDEATFVHVAPLRAVRIDDRLVTSARAHSLDMQRRGFFSHHAPPNPATGEPGTSPFDRMRTAGYQGGGASENIAAGATSPEQAHDRWCHSSGHHRNILSLWTDQGVGQAGRLWTQNFGTGGGGPPVIETPAEEEGASEETGGGGRRRPR